MTNHPRAHGLVDKTIHPTLDRRQCPFPSCGRPPHSPGTEVTDISRPTGRLADWLTGPKITDRYTEQTKKAIVSNVRRWRCCIYIFQRRRSTVVAVACCLGTIPYLHTAEAKNQTRKNDPCSFFDIYTFLVRARLLQMLLQMQCQSAHSARTAWVLEDPYM